MTRGLPLTCLPYYLYWIYLVFTPQGDLCTNGHTVAARSTLPFAPDATPPSLWQLRLLHSLHRILHPALQDAVATVAADAGR